MEGGDGGRRCGWRRRVWGNAGVAGREVEGKGETGGASKYHGPSISSLLHLFLISCPASSCACFVGPLGCARCRVRALLGPASRLDWPSLTSAGVGAARAQT